MTRLLQIFFQHYRKQVLSLLIAFYKLSKSLILLHERCMFFMCLTEIHKKFMADACPGFLVSKAKLYDLTIDCNRRRLLVTAHFLSAEFGKRKYDTAGCCEEV